jgi:hypothetical protein
MICDEISHASLAPQEHVSMDYDQRPQKVCLDNKLVFERSPTSPQWAEDDYIVLTDGRVVGRIVFERAAPKGLHWFWTLTHDQREGRSPAHGYAATREAARAALAAAAVA